MTGAGQSEQQFCIIGAGGIGSFYASKLLSAQQRCVMVARGQRLTQLLEQGLIVSHQQRQHRTTQVLANTLEQMFQLFRPTQFTAVLLCTKSSATKDLAADIANWFAKWQSSCPVISLQNGIDNEATLAQLLPPQCVFGGLAVKIGAHLEPNGTVMATGPGELILGVWPQDTLKSFPADVIVTLERTEIPFKVSSDIQKELWLKLVINNGVNPISALTGLDTLTLSCAEPFATIVYGLMKEAAVAAFADGVIITDEEVKNMFDLIANFDPIKTSMLVDYEKGRPLELAAICGVVLARHQQLESDAPYTRLVNALLEHRQMLYAF